MSYYTAEEMRKLLNENPQYRDKLYCRGFLITSDTSLNLDEYPFYGNWKKIFLSDKFVVYYHKLVSVHTVKVENVVHFVIGHAYNPFTMEYEEETILETLGKKLEVNQEEYWDKESELTGVFCIGYLCNDSLVISTDCTGMQLMFYGVCKEKIFITSHAKLVGDLCGFKQTDYVKRLVGSRFYKYWGTWLPGDLSPYAEMKRVQPNFYYQWNCTNKNINFERYFPTKEIKEVSESESESLMVEIADIMKRNMELISKKWGKRAAVSVTGGRDSTSTLASANTVYDKLQFFSYKSNDNESVDADAAHSICKYLGLEHKIYTIPSDDSEFDDIEIYRKILECNAGCIGHNNANDVRKRIFFDRNNDFDVEVKSWVSELVRGEAQNKYGMLKWPPKPSPGYYRCMWKVIVNPRLIQESNLIFKNYLCTYYNDEVLSYLPWMDFFYWEFSWSGGEGTFLTSEHKFSYDITIPFNNRKLLEKAFSLPLELRVQHKVPIDIIEINNPTVREANILIKNAAHTDLWTTMIRIYLKIFSKIG